MPTVKQANMRLAKMLGEEKHFRHAFSEQLRRFILEEAGFDLYQMPICPRCERLAYWDKGGAAFCLHCGPISPPVVTFGEFYEAGYATDRTLHPDAPVMVDRSLAKPADILTVVGGEADLQDTKKILKVIIPGKELPS